MRKTIYFLLAVAMMCLVAWRLQAADQAASNADEQAIRDACQAYAKAVNAGDASAIVKFWTEDADYVTDTGEKYKGRPALAKLFRETLPSLKGKKFTFDTKSLRMIASGVAIEDGEGTLTGDDADVREAVTRYTAVWVRTGDQWLISSVRDLGDVPAEEKNAAPLKQLDWMVGDWHSENSDTQVEMNCAFALDEKFLKQKYEVQAKDGQKFTVVTLVGWDPSSGSLRSWFFDSRGGFGDGEWTRDGNSWKISANGVVADGRHGTSTNIWKFEDNNTIVWSSKDRELEGVPMPDNDVKFVRKAQPESNSNASTNQ